MKRYLLKEGGMYWIKVATIKEAKKIIQEVRNRSKRCGLKIFDRKKGKYVEE